MKLDEIVPGRTYALGRLAVTAARGTAPGEAFTLTSGVCGWIVDERGRLWHQVASRGGRPALLQPSNYTVAMLAPAAAPVQQGEHAVMHGGRDYETRGVAK